MKTYTLIQVSKNCNAFGLREHIFLARDGQGWRALRSLHTPGADKHKPGDKLEFDPSTGPASRNRRTGEGWECCRPLAPCPPALARKVCDEAEHAAQILES